MHGRVTEGWSAGGGRRGRRRASIHIHPGVATGTLITCFNLPTADWASICHSKSVIARGSHPFSRRSVESHGSASSRIAITIPYWCRLALSLNREPRRSRGLCSGNHAACSQVEFKNPKLFQLSYGGRTILV